MEDDSFEATKLHPFMIETVCRKKGSVQRILTDNAVERDLRPRDWGKKKTRDVFRRCDFIS